VRRTRTAGERVDRVALDPAGLEPKGFDTAVYLQNAALAREALGLLRDAPAERRAVLEEAAAFYDFLAARLPELQAEWHRQRKVYRDQGGAT
jgi:hypothetical protein